MENTPDGPEKKFSELSKRLSEDFHQAIVHRLPKLAVQMDELHAECKGIKLEQSEVHLKVSPELVAMLDKVLPVCSEATEQMSLIESKLRRLISDTRIAGEVSVCDVLERSLRLAEALRRGLEDFLSQLTNFHISRSYHVRKWLKFPDQDTEALAEFEYKILYHGQLQLAKGRNVMVDLHKMLNDNLEHLTGERLKSSAARAHPSMYY